MAGLALGGALAASFAGGVRRLLLTYAALELTVAVSGIALTYTLPFVTTVLASITSRLTDAPWILNLVRLVTAFGLLLIPTAAMGATLPALVGALSRQHKFGDALGHLYGWNTAGAVIGVLGTELVLIGRYGVMGSAWVAAIADLFAASLVLWTANRLKDDGPTIPASPLAAPPAAAWPLLACTFLAGGALMALEIVWFRFLTMFVVSSTDAASMMLAAVLAAIGIGALLGSFWLARRPRADDWLPAISVLMACATVVSSQGVQSLTGGTQVCRWCRLWLACALTFPTALMLGVLFTLIGQALERVVDPDTRAAGWLTFANTTGSMLGPLVAAFALLPRLGMERSVFIIAIIYAAIGMAAYLANGGRNGARAPRHWFAAISMLGIAVLGFFPFGLMAREYFPRASMPYAAEGERIIATREGTTATIFLMQQARAGPDYHRLVTDGFSMTGTSLAAQRYNEVLRLLAATGERHAHQARAAHLLRHGHHAARPSGSSIPSSRSRSSRSRRT